MPNVRLLVAYKGTQYHGWANQPGVPTVEGALRQAVGQFLNVDVGDFFLQGASRTDAGVHAIAQTVNIKHEVANRPLKGFVRGLNTLTPEDITICRAEFVSDAFHARHSARGKLYRYTIWNHRFKDPFQLDSAWHWNRQLDVDAMRAAAAVLLGEHDFRAFRASDCESPTTVRTLTRVDIDDHGPQIIIWVEGTAFLKYMVRIITGTLVAAGMGRLTPDDIAAMFEHGDRQKGGQTAPPQGLTLMQIYYPDEPWADPTPYLGGQPMADKDL